MATQTDRQEPTRETTRRGVAGASERITSEVTSWPGVSAGFGSRGEYGFSLGRRALGHLHGDHALHIGFPKRTGRELREQGRVVDHPVFPATTAGRRVGSTSTPMSMTRSGCCG